MFYEIFIWFGPFWNITWPATDHQISWVHNGLSGTQRTYWYFMVQDKIVRCYPRLAIMTGCSLIWLSGIHKQTDISAPVVPSFFSPNLSSLFCSEPPFLFLTWLGAVFLYSWKWCVEFVTTLFAYLNQLLPCLVNCLSIFSLIARQVKLETETWNPVFFSCSKSFSWRKFLRESGISTDDCIYIN